MGSIPIARSNAFVFMVSCKFQISSKLLPQIDTLEEEGDFDNISVFENTELGFSDMLDQDGFPIAKFFDVEILVKNEKNAKQLQQCLSERFGDEIHFFHYASLKDEDWVQAYIDELKPVICDNFYFYNGTIQPAPVQTKYKNTNLIPIKLNSALAFGSGHHQTTQACLLNMRYLFEQNTYEVKNILDMGCGTGILGICALKLWNKAKLIGIDIDAEAVKITEENYRANEINATTIIGSHPPEEADKFDLIFCNILKQPLVALCADFARVIKTNAHIITSGYITSQEAEITKVYTAQGFESINRIQIDDWVSIMFRENGV